MDEEGAVRYGRWGQYDTKYGTDGDSTTQSTVRGGDSTAIAHGREVPLCVVCRKGACPGLPCLPVLIGKHVKLAYDSCRICGTKARHEYADQRVAASLNKARIRFIFDMCCITDAGDRSLSVRLLRRSPRQQSRPIMLLVNAVQAPPMRWLNEPLSLWTRATNLTTPHLTDGATWLVHFLIFRKLVTSTCMLRYPNELSD